MSQNLQYFRFPFQIYPIKLVHLNHPYQILLILVATYPRKFFINLLIQLLILNRTQHILQLLKPTDLQNILVNYFQYLKNTMLFKFLFVLSIQFVNMFQYLLDNQSTVMALITQLYYKKFQKQHHLFFLIYLLQTAYCFL